MICIDGRKPDPDLLLSFQAAKKLLSQGGKLKKEMEKFRKEPTISGQGMPPTMREVHVTMHLKKT